MCWNEFNVDTSRETEYNRRSRQVDAWNDIAKTTKFDKLNFVLTFCLGFCLELVKKLAANKFVTWPILNKNSIYLQKQNISTDAPGKDHHPMFLLSITISKLKID